ncbi:MAG: cation:dicarboxylase symporter family transporter [Candidatus Latescibacteria bacterium]|nr:cation:dicarboxylase symporter family transporter [Candidatus Latescibacterota bacterium]NIM22066.1 cation:dicarboxylase symporter family transporter [Candidatus Latescibacterota bacterium]NIM66085.1 cation:dicarboxylase symporter family transporter [Candidatus Latescibacterota bacterium]NIO02493.1 cation:dicarboxylase symporter family transporter [Candidatus Latescibacterota bacterium]NIO29404.1 cation:dicarboxylase symporter family transporter [Candidatus Latescibacterota bacterium]
MKLHWKILIGMLMGVFIGLLVNESFVLPGVLGDFLGKFAFVRAFAIKVIQPLLGPVGSVFIKLLKMLIVPLILASMIVGVAKVGDVRKLGGLSGRTFAFYITTTWASVVVGLIVVNIIEPGSGAPALVSEVPEAAYSAVSVWSVILNMIPDNPIKAMANMDILPIIVFALMLGAILTTLGEKGKPLVSFFDSLNEAMMRLADVVIRLTPIGVFALLAEVVAQTGPGIFANLGKYMFTVILGLSVHAFVTLPLLLALVGRTSPRKYVSYVSPALTTAFSTASSSATLPLTLDCVSKRAGLSAKVSSFVLPLGATINMDGTALYESVAAVFIAQVYGIDLTFSQQLLVFFTATLAAIGAAGIPSAGLVTMAIVLKAVGLPLEGIGMILAVDRILDMCRTTVNVWGDTVGCAVVTKLQGEDIPASIR